MSKERSHYNHPVFRLGKICETRKKFTCEASVFVINSIRKSSFQILKELINQLSSLGCEHIRQVDRNIYVAKDEGNIANFPGFEFSFMKYSLFFRNSIAVCEPGHSTKIWTRFMLLSQESSKASGLTVSQVQQYYEDISRLAYDISNYLVDVYFEFLSTIGKPRNKCSIYDISISTTNTHSPAFHDLIAAIKYSQAGFDSLLEDSKNSTVFQEAFGCFMPHAFHRSFHLEKSIPSPKHSKWLAYLKDDSEGIYALNHSKKSTEIRGVTYSFPDEVSLEYPSEIGSRAILKYFARNL